MEEVIKSIIESIPSGYVFDTHAIIEYLLQNNSDIYLSSYNGNSTELYHGDIGRLIAEFENTIIERVGDSWSLNIHKRFSKCAYWRKL